GGGLADAPAAAQTPARAAPARSPLFIRSPSPGPTASPRWHKLALAPSHARLVECQFRKLAPQGSLSTPRRSWMRPLLAGNPSRRPPNVGFRDCRQRVKSTLLGSSEGP